MKDKSLGGLSAPHVKAMMLASRIAWLKRYHCQKKSFWHVTWDYFMKKINGNPDLLWLCNFDETSVNIDKAPIFDQEIVKSWLILKSKEYDKTSQIIWNNIDIKIENRTIYWDKFVDLGIMTLNDLIDENKDIIPYEYWHQKGLNEYLKWRAIITIANKHRHLASIKAETKNEISVIINKIETPLVNIKSKIIYTHILNNILGTDISAPRVSKFKNCNLDWRNIYLTGFKTFSDTRTREFHYKFLNDILVNNYWLKKWKIKDDDKCRLCKSETETLLHQFWSCPEIQRLWLELENELRELGIQIKFTEEDMLFGQTEKTTITNIINLLTKKYIYFSYFKDKKPELLGFQRYLQNYVNLEAESFKQSNTFYTFTERWYPLRGFVNLV